MGGSMVEVENLYLDFLIGFMGDDFFQEKRNFYHPFYQDYWILKKLYFNQVSGEFSALKKATVSLATAQINAYTLSITSKQKEDKLFAFGDFTWLGSDDVRRDIEGRLGAKITGERGKRTRGKNSETMISELCVASWLLLEGGDFIALQEDSMPDFMSLSQNICVECKAYIEAKSIDSFLEQHVSKANRQLGNAAQQFNEELIGVLVLDLTRYFAQIPMLDESNGFLGFSEQHHSKVKESTLAQLNNRKNIHWVLYYWDEIQTTSRSISVDIMRRSRWIKNGGVQSDPPLPIYALRVSNSLILSEPHEQMYRNSRCFCGSGLRFKHCHGRLA
jgi:hypothetical protein